jgi:hypothetical protein
MKMVVGVFFALLLTNATFAATNTVNGTTNKTVVVSQATLPPAEAWVLSLNGAGSTTTRNSTTAFGLEMGLGRTGHLLLPLEAGVRQSVEYPFGINVDGVEHKRTLSYCIGLQMKF